MAAEINLTTLGRVANYLDVGVADVRESGQLVWPGMISAVSNSIANLCNRDFAVKVRRERRKLARPTFFFSDGPARSISQVRYSPNGNFTASAVVVAANGYDLAFDGMSIDLSTVFTGDQVWEVTYTGGMVYSTNAAKYNATATGAVPSTQQALPDGRKMTVTAFASDVVTFSADAGSFREGEVLTLSNSTVLTLGAVVEESVCNDAPDLEQACLMQVAYLWQRHKNLGRSSFDMGNGQTQFVKDYDLLPGVRTLLTRYSRPYTFL